MNNEMNSVIQHLLFHKSISNGDDNFSIDRYLDMAEKAETGEYHSIENPFDKSIALVFDLVIQQHLDPWAIDLAKFSSLYINRAKKEKIDFVVAGKLLYMAWKILKMQSYDVMINAERYDNQTNNEDIDWDDLSLDEWYLDEDKYSYTRMIVDSHVPPIMEPVRRKSKRRVSLIELIEAFDKARKEAEKYQLIEKLRKQEKERLLNEAKSKIKGTVHEEHFEKDIKRMWKRLKNFNGKTVSLDSLCNFESKDERITAFIAVLHLAYDKKVKVYQKNFPFGKIYVRNVGG